MIPGIAAYPNFGIPVIVIHAKQTVRNDGRQILAGYH